MRCRNRQVIPGHSSAIADPSRVMTFGDCPGSHYSANTYILTADSHKSGLGGLSKPASATDSSRRYHNSRRRGAQRRGVARPPLDKSRLAHNGSCWSWHHHRIRRRRGAFNRLQPQDRLSQPGIVVNEPTLPCRQERRVFVIKQPVGCL